MPYKWVDPDIFLKHSGIKIYYAYKDGWHSDPFNYHYTTDVTEDEEDKDKYEFDVRDLHCPYKIDKKDHKAIIRHAINLKLLELPEGVKYRK